MARTTFGALLALLLGAGAAEAQATIRPGMTRAEVEAAFGQPAAVRTADGWTYLYYPNGCPRRCGSDDVVFLRDGRVVAAVLRSPRRRFAGPPASLALQQVPDARTPGRFVPTPRRDVPMVRGVRVQQEPPAVNLGVIRGEPPPPDTAPPRRAAPDTARRPTRPDTGRTVVAPERAGTPAVNPRLDTVPRRPPPR